MGTKETVSLRSLVTVVVLCDIPFTLQLFILGLGLSYNFLRGGLFDMFTCIYHTSFRKGLKAIMSSHPGSKQFLL